MAKAHEILGDHVQFTDVKYSYLKSFPNIDIQVLDLSVYDDDFRSLFVKEIQIKVNPLELINQKIKIEEITLTNAHFSQVINEKGEKTQLFKPTTQSTGEKGGLQLLFKSDKVLLDRFSLSVINKIKGNHLQVSQLSGQMGFVMQDTLISIIGDISGVMDSLVSNNNPLFIDIPVRASQLEFNINKITQTKSITAEALFAKGLKLLPKISFTKQNDGNLVDMKISGMDVLDNYLRVFDLLEDQDLNQVNPDARVSFSFNQSGFVNPWERPYSEINFEISEADVKGKNLPFPIKNLFIKGNFNNGEAHGPESSQLEVDTIHLEVEGSYVNGRFLVTDLKDPWVKGNLDMLLHLDHLLKNENITASGKVEAMVEVDGRISRFRQAQLSKKNYARGFFRLSGINLQTKNDSLKVHDGSIKVQNHEITIESLLGFYRGTNFNMDGQLYNLDQFLLGEDSLFRGKVNLNFDKLDLTSLRSSDKVKPKKKGMKIPDVSLVVNLSGKSVKTGFGDITSLRANSIIKPDGVTVNKLTMNYNKGKVSVTGKIDYIDDKIQAITGVVDADIGVFDIDKLLLDRAGSDNSMGPDSLALPDVMDLTVNLQIDQGKIKGYKFNDLLLNADISHDRIKIKRMRLDAFSGRFFLYSDIRFNNQGIWYIKANGNTRLQNLNIAELIPQHDESYDAATVKETRLPEYIDIAIGMQADKVSYKSLQFDKIRTGVSFSRNNIKVDEFELKLPGGTASLELSVDDYLTNDPTVVGLLDVDFDTLDFNQLDQFYAHKDLKKHKENISNSTDIIFSLPDNLNLSAEIDANIVKFNHLYLSDLSTKSTYNDRAFSIDHLYLGAAGGMLDISGIFVEDEDLSIGGHVFSKASQLRISDLLSSFDNFDQELFTSDNTLGLITWQSDYYFRLDSTFKIMDDENLWMFEITIDNGEIIDNQVIKDALSFIGQDVKEKIFIENASFQTFLYKDVLILEHVMVNNNISNMNIHGAFNKAQSDIDVNLQLSLNDLLFRSKDKRIVETKEGVVNLGKDMSLFLHISGPVDETKVKLNNKKKFNRNRAELNRDILQIENDLRLRINSLYRRAQPKIKPAELASLNNRPDPAP